MLLIITFHAIGVDLNNLNKVHLNSSINGL